MSLNSIKRDLKDYIEENKARLEAWENVTYLTKKDGTPFKSMSKNFTNATYKRKESFRGYILEVDTKFTKNQYFRNYIDCGNKDNPNTLEEIKQKVSEEIESTKRFIKSLEKRLEIGPENGSKITGGRSYAKLISMAICKCQWCRRSLLWIKQYPKD